MGMIFFGRRLTAEELARVTADPATAMEVLLLHSEADRTIDVDKAWQGLYNLLADADPQNPVRDALLRGDPIDSDDMLTLMSAARPSEAILGGDPVWPDDPDTLLNLLSADRVQAVHAALSGIDREALGARYDAAAFAADEVYPSIWDDDGALEYLLQNYDALRAFYAAAAAAESAVLISIG